MSTAHKTKAETKEFFDSPEVLRDKCRRLAALIRAARHAIAFTGAGISTSCGVPDFRSGMGTCLSVGPGAWELKAKGKIRAPSARTTSTLCAIPSYTHMAFVELQRRGLLRHLVSQNTDGLHRRSGFPPEALSELHGNSNLERCRKCGAEYLRDFSCRQAGRAVHDHRTSRRCEAMMCNGMLCVRRRSAPARCPRPGLSKPPPPPSCQARHHHQLRREPAREGAGDGVRPRGARGPVRLAGLQPARHAGGRHPTAGGPAEHGGR